ncbi:hypothetical protein HPB50_011290 [Hyalomma asiaticum]|uniref:Uncharacterized protein n=1 Tax=Hyalomma asiaticum TaxID=266040 RepID=A0ACB7TI96_HYAAI|nr:hypothetical protein HPB50_011290 [Hyalomma asiaticum]
MAPDAKKAERAIREAHSTFATYLRRARYRNLNDLDYDAKWRDFRSADLQAAANALRLSRTPCACAGGGWSPRIPPKYEVASAAREHRDVQVLSDRALDPYTFARACPSFAPNGQRERDPRAPMHAPVL